MGIRYYAYPVPGDRIDDAHRDPGLFLGADPLGDAWGLVPVSVETENGETVASDCVFALDAKPRPTMLYLDKAFRVFQDIFSGRDDDSGPRESYTLVEGMPSVSYGQDYSFTPWVRVLDTTDTAAIARDLMLVPLVADDHPALARGITWKAEDINNFLRTAAQFMSDRAAAGDGVVYTIR
ncbi:hypothetical protein GPOL_c25630 [Gordonia polyisoprenivorans VH2]|uniref:DUF1877 domain-containing protein n=2 Tax=Gordonia polyisoprenivorans TaxID=84595 RepID=H6N4K8_GORPV|nr:hypothetical protein [Gordonia polyisoprenivorans]AFA73590.1 hypothetical protein GPOL_c25630 [Gordonia polyisoprenivorans VH2]NKY04095.1 hypothetical protein [Gordonia polyisoprenivorans]UZF53997.1 hypothetical protein LH935_14595 [Gordonia polyisoprenivorans]GAB21525.1 hypothetical protein GOPIP_009_00790 [Gordonia polyisoprenivorans NBRC 16320 = JCM 10675]